MSQEQFYQSFKEIRNRFPELKKWQAYGTALISGGIIRARKSQASLIAEELPEFGKASTVERRIQRWMANPRIDISQTCVSWIRWVVERYQGQKIYLLVDETKIGDRIACMMISLAIQKRAIPLIWRCYRANSANDYPSEGQVKMIADLLEKIVAIVPENKQIILEADRGIGNSSNLMREVSNLGAKFLFRVQKDSIFTSNDLRMSLGNLATYKQEWHGEGTLYTQQHQVQCHVHILWDAGQSEPWCLATNMEGLTGREYAFRVWQEESFRDLKSGGWQWQNSLIRTPEFIERLLLPMTIAYAWCMTTGLLFLSLDEETRLAVDYIRKHKKYCTFRLGLRFIKRYLFLDPSKVPLQIGPFFAPG